MAFVPFADVIKLEAIYNYQGQRCENVHYFRVDATPDVNTANDLAEAYVQWWSTNLAPLQPNDVALDMVKCTIMEQENSPGIEYTSGLPTTGNQVSDPLPNNATVTVKWITGLRGRSYRGRTYHIGLGEAFVHGNTLDANYHANLTAAYFELMSLPVDVGPAVMVVASRVENGVERTVGVSTLVTSMSIDPTIDSQRRRLPGRGK